VSAASVTVEKQQDELREQVERIVSDAPASSTLLFCDFTTGKNVAFREGLEGGSAILHVLNFDRLAAIREGRWSIRPGDNLNRAEQKAMRARCRKTLARLRKRMLEASRQDDPTDPQGAPVRTADTPLETGERGIEGQDPAEQEAEPRRRKIGGPFVPWEG
jgi:hypothetical protein